MNLKKIAIYVGLAGTLLVANQVEASQATRYIPSIKVGHMTNGGRGLISRTLNFYETYMLVDCLAVLSIPTRLPFKEKYYQAFYSHHLKNQHAAKLWANTMEYEHVVLMEEPDEGLERFLRNDTQPQSGFSAVFDHGNVSDKLELNPNSASLILFKRGVFDCIREIELGGLIPHH